MIHEIALLPVHKERVEMFRGAFAGVAPLLIRAKGYGGHLLAQGIETPPAIQPDRAMAIARGSHAGFRRE